MAEEKSDTFSLNISEINDEEFHIPIIEETPTLESILREDESSLLSEDDLALFLPNEPLNTYKESHDNLSVSSGVYRDYQTFTTVTGITEYKYDPGHILRHSVLRAITAQLKSANERVNAGYPTVMNVCVVIAVGTSYGLVFVFDEKQTLRWCHDVDGEKSSVSALCLNNDCSRLLAGYACGTILMFDASDGKLLRTMVDVHTPSTAVLHIKFTDISTLALCSDSGGSVFELNFKRTLGIRGVDSKCIFSGSKGEVCSIEPLLLHHLNSHPLGGSTLVAMATLSKLIVVCIRPTMKVLLTHSVRADPCSLPFLSWQFMIIQLAENFRIMDPVLAFARDNYIHFYQVNIGLSNNLKCTMLQRLDLDYSLLTCHWLNTRMMAMLDTKEQLHLFDVRNREELEKLDLSRVGLVYNSSHFKGLVTGGNVSQAMALAGERACYNTVQCYGNQVLFLGVKSCHVVSIRSWIERLDCLVDKGRFECALRLGIEFLEERGRVIVGLQGRHQQRNELVKNKIIEILMTYIDLFLNGGTAIVPVTNSMHTIINVAVSLQRTDLLFERLWDGFEYNGDTVCRDVFLQNLGMAIIDEKILNIPPAVMQQIVRSLAERHMWKELELCILNTNIECLDIEQVLQLSRQNSLHSALISIWNRGMMDYTSPLQELLPRLQSALEKEENEYARDLGNKLFVYISYCFAGQAYPRGNINESTTENVRNQVFQCLCNQHSVNSNEYEEIYPHLRLLFKFDTKEFVNVLSKAFDDSKFSVQMKQRFADILISIIFQPNSFKAQEIGIIFNFLSKQTDREKSRPISLDTSLYMKVAKLLAESSDVSTHEVRQQAFLELVLADNLHHFEENYLLNLAEKANFYQVCREIYQRKTDFSQVLKYYLLDAAKEYEVFSYIERWTHKVDLQPYVLNNFKNLVEISSERTGFIFGKYYPDLIQLVKDSLSRRNLYYFLKGASHSTELDSSLITLYMQLQCELCNENEILHFVLSHKNLLLEPALKASKKHNLCRVTAIILDRLGNYQDAFNVLFEKLQNTIEKGSGIEDATEELISLMRRRSFDLESRITWLPLLQCLSNLNSRELLKRVLGSADLNLATELHLLLQNNPGTLGDFRDLITGLYEKCVYEHSMLKAVSRIVYADLHSQLAKTITESKCGVSSLDTCCLCQHSFRNTFSLLRCGHGYHLECAESIGSICFRCSVLKDKNYI